MSALRRFLEPRLQQAWYGRGWLAKFLRPFGCLTCALASLRYTAYRRGWLRSVRLPVPVVVVGNLAVGGTGKTPFVIWLAAQLGQRGLRAGIITRGYGGSSHLWPRHVTSASDPVEVGDEPLVIARRSGCTVMAGPDRVAAGHALLALDGVDVLLSDDGLQHYSLARDVEFVMVDGQRGLGNGRCLPAGPLREPAGRLRDADLCIMKDSGSATLAGSVCMRTRLGDAVPLRGGQSRPLAEFRSGPVHAVAALGNPQSFFDALRAQGLTVIEHPLPDHAHPEAGDIEYTDDLPVLMTEKDMVKCVHLGTERHWYVPLEVEFDAQDDERVIACVTASIQHVTGHGTGD